MNFSLNIVKGESKAMTTIHISTGRRFLRTLLTTLILVLLPISAGASNEQVQTVIVTAEGLADPNAEAYARDKALMIVDLRQDARRQAIEKAVGVYVESSTLVENYLLIEDRVLSKSRGLIKQILEQSAPRLGEDGLMHMEITAEVFLSDVKEALDTLSRQSRLILLKDRGNPTISVAVVIGDADRGSSLGTRSSAIAENILKQHFVDFGYRVWSEDYTKMLRQEAGAQNTPRRMADFSVIGETKFKQASVTLKASGIELTKHILTSWTVKCVNNNTGEEVYFNNKVPRNRSWADEDQALEDVGKLIGQEFSKGFFESQLMRPAQRYQIQLIGLPDYDTALLFRKEFVGLRNILSAELMHFESGGLSTFEIECTSGGSDFLQIFNNTILKPLNAKLEGPRLKLTSYRGNVITVTVDPGPQPEKLYHSLQDAPPASLSTASPERIAKIVEDSRILEKITQMNPAMNTSMEPR